MILSPLIRLSGHSRSQETKWCSVFHLLISHPASLRIVIVVVTSIPSIWVRSVPVMKVYSKEVSSSTFPSCPSGAGSLQNQTAFPLEQRAAHGQPSFTLVRSSSAFRETRRRRQ